VSSLEAAVKSITVEPLKKRITILEKNFNIRPHQQRSPSLSL
jgi:hypothetical protein